MELTKNEFEPIKSHWQQYLYAGNARSGIPDYLAKNYWWAYLSPVGVALFDHPFIVNRILWGQYHHLVKDCSALLGQQKTDKLAQISCAYGEIIPNAGIGANAEQIYLLDVASIQLEKAYAKIKNNDVADRFTLLRANAESLPLATNSMDTSLIFFLLHELPESSRKAVINQALRITKSGGRLVIADYAQMNGHHWFHRLGFFRNIFENLEPFLGNFWRANLLKEIDDKAKNQGKKVTLSEERYYWGEFYRLLAFDVSDDV